jgi:hypothetical protein
MMLATKAAAGIRAVDEREDAASDVVTAVNGRGGLDRVGVGGPHVGAAAHVLFDVDRDLLATAGTGDDELVHGWVMTRLMASRHHRRR